MNKKEKHVWVNNSDIFGKDFFITTCIKCGKKVNTKKQPLLPIYGCSNKPVHEHEK